MVIVREKYLAHHGIKGMKKAAHFTYVWDNPIIREIDVSTFE